MLLETSFSPPLCPQYGHSVSDTGVCPGGGPRGTCRIGAEDSQAVCPRPCVTHCLAQKRSQNGICPAQSWRGGVSLLLGWPSVRSVTGCLFLKTCPWTSALCGALGGHRGVCLVRRTEFELAWNPVSGTARGQAREDQEPCPQVDSPSREAGLASESPSRDLGLSSGTWVAPGPGVGRPGTGVGSAFSLFGRRDAPQQQGPPPRVSQRRGLAEGSATQEQMTGLQAACPLLGNKAGIPLTQCDN